MSIADAAIKSVVKIAFSFIQLGRLRVSVSGLFLIVNLYVQFACYIALKKYNKDLSCSLCMCFYMKCVALFLNAIGRRDEYLFSSQPVKYLAKSGCLSERSQSLTFGFNVTRPTSFVCGFETSRTWKSVTKKFICFGMLIIETF